MDLLLVAINAKFIHSSLAVRTLHAYFAQKGYNTRIVEFTINQHESQVISELFNMAPDILAFSCYIWNIEMVRSIASSFKKIMPDVKIIAGGPEVSCGDFYDPNIDAIVMGEVPFGEAPFVYEDCFGGFEDLNNRIIYYETSRGCFNRCGYCLSGATGGAAKGAANVASKRASEGALKEASEGVSKVASKVIEFLPLERILRELDIFLYPGKLHSSGDCESPLGQCDKASLHSKKLQQAYLRQVKFVDRTFNCNKRHAMEIWRHLIQNDNGVTNFHFEIAGDLLDDDAFDLLKKARPGLFQFEIGVQSTNPETLKAICRETNIDKLLKNAKRLKNMGNIHIHLDLIAGLPYENLESFVRSFDEVMACIPDHLQVGFLKLIRGSTLREDASKYGIEFTDRPPYEILSSRFLSFGEIDMLKKVSHMVELFYNSGNFRTYMKYVLSGYESDYKFFESLAIYWAKNNYHLYSHKKSALFSIL